MRALFSALEGLYISKTRGYYRVQPIMDRFRKTMIPTITYSSTKKLNLGSSHRLIPTYLNVDVLEENKPDIVCNVRELKFSQDSEYDLVRASHVLEHFTREEIPDILKEWRRVLKEGSFLVVCVPDYLAISWRAILKPSGFDLNERTYANGWIKGLFALTLPPEFRHQIVFTYRSLVRLLTECGFKVVGRQHYRVEEPFTLGIIDDSCDPFSLNIAFQKV
jgi:predicted SAM-dependent methyltransferase